MSGSAQELKAVFTAEDRTSSVLRQIGASLRGLVGSSGIGRLASIGGQLAGTMSGIAQAGILATASLAGLGGAASVAGLAALGVSTASTAAGLKALADSSHVPIAQLEVLADIARRANVSQDDLGAGLGVLNERMRSAARGGNAELRQIMARIGISLRDASGQLRNAADVLPGFANAFQRIRDPALRAELATAVFGETGARLLPILTGGAAGLREGERNFQRWGVSIAGMAEALAPISAQFDDLRNSLSGFGQSVTTAIGSELAPILGPIASDMAKWIQENRAWIATDIAKHIREATVAVRDFFKEQDGLDRLQRFGTSVRSVVTSLGGLKGIMIGFGALVISPFAAAMISVATTFGTVALAVGRLSLALLATPAGWFLGAAAAIAYAAYKVYENWDSIAGFFRRFGPQVTEMGSLVRGLGSALWSLMVGAWENSPLARFLRSLREDLEALLPVARDVAAFVQRITGAGAGTEPNASSNPAMNAPAQALRLGRFGRRGDIYGPAPEEPDDPRFYIGRNVLQGPRLPESPLALSPGLREGRVQVEVTINGPAGTRAEARSEGSLVGPPVLNYGLNLGARP